MCVCVCVCVHMDVHSIYLLTGSSMAEYAKMVCAFASDCIFTHLNSLHNYWPMCIRSITAY